MTNKSEIIKTHLRQHPNYPTLTLAKMIYKSNPLLFPSVENVRDIIRYYRGAKGLKSLNEVKPNEFLTPENRIKKYSLPEAIETEYKPYLIHGERGLIFSDVHIPFHSISALETMFDFTHDKNIDFIIINGDLMDCFDVSYFTHEPNLVTMNEEREMCKQFLKELKNIYPTAKIYYKFANHEDRWEKYLMSHPEIFDMPEFRMEIILDLFNIGIEYIQSDKYIIVNGGLTVWHGHEYKGGITSPANPARTAFLRAKDSAVIGHYHQSSEHTEPTITGKIITCWSLGCMCGLHPQYMPLNKWNHGFGLYRKEDDEFWRIENKRIIKGRVV